MAVTYNPVVIQKEAARLYRLAILNVIAYTLIGVGVGATLSGAVSLPGRFFGQYRGSGNGEALLLLSSLVGLLLGSEKATALRVRAHQMLCLAAIEANTRPAQEALAERAA